MLNIFNIGKMMKKLGFLGFLGLIGLLGVITHDYSWFGFFGFFGFFAFLREKHHGKDERLARNYDRAARNGFIFTVIVLASSIATINLAITPTVSSLVALIVFIFALNLLIFAISVIYYDRKGN